jgi:TatD DNase family protein
MEEIIDTHAHLYHKNFAIDISEILDRAREQGLKRIYLPNIDLESIEPMLLLEEKTNAYCIATMGLHPCSVTKDFEKVLYEMEAWFSRRQFVAVGEIGLDYYWDKTFIGHQKEALRIQLSWARQRGIPAILHTRDSIDDTIAILKENVDDKSQKGVFHCFSGNIEQAKEIIDLGFYLGIGGVVTFKNGGLDTVLPEIGIDKLVLETDSPYLAPVPYRGKRNESAYTAIIAEKLADVLKLDLDEVRSKTTANALALFQP